MEINPLEYKLNYKGKLVNVPAGHFLIASKLDKDKDAVIHDDDIRDYLEREMVEYGEPHEASSGKLISDFKRNLLGKPMKSAALYPMYNEYVQQMRDMETKYPSLAKVAQYGTAVNGTPLYALRLSTGAAAGKPEFLFTGLTHAREWATGMVVMQTARNFLEGYGKDQAITNRLNKADVWFIPVVNPEGYDYSRTVDSFWRKNLEVIHQDDVACPASGATHDEVATGVDLNRNWFDPKHAQFYRISGDSPCSTQDDYGASDDPSAEDYRGRGGASEPEVQYLQKFIDAHRKNLLGIIDHHSFGNEILFPWGHTDRQVSNVQEYLDCANFMRAAGGSNFTVKQSVGLYPTTGSSEDYEHANGIFNYTLEIGTSFHSTQAELTKLLGQIPKMDAAFIDWRLTHNAHVTDAELPAA